jgi:hypothetical protein
MMNGSVIRTGACFHWNENPRTSALRDICTADLYRRRMCLERRGFQMGKRQAAASLISGLAEVARLRPASCVRAVYNDLLLQNTKAQAPATHADRLGQER